MKGRSEIEARARELAQQVADRQRKIKTLPQQSPVDRLIYQDEARLYLTVRSRLAELLWVLDVQDDGLQKWIEQTIKEATA